MLVLARKLGEKLVIPGCGLTITVLRIQGKKVRLGITASPAVEIHREEVWRRISAVRDEDSQLVPLTSTT
jgi:carbon storage regulator